MLGYARRWVGFLLWLASKKNRTVIAMGLYFSTPDDIFLFACSSLSKEIRFPLYFDINSAASFERPMLSSAAARSVLNLLMKI